MNQVLFLCSRNICSSRVAAAFFNHVARGHYEFESVSMRSLAGWKAISRGLTLDETESINLSLNAIDFLEEQGVDFDKAKSPLSVEPSDLLWSDRVIALFEPEHRPIIESQFSFWANRIEYWNVPDFHESNWGKALPKLEANVLELVSVIRSSEKVVSH